MAPRVSPMMRSTLAAAVTAALATTAACTTTAETSATAPSADKCQVNVSNAPSAFAASGGAGTVTIDATRDCTWSVAPSVGWVTITGSTTGQGGESVGYMVAANPIPASRTGAINVGSQSVSLSQAAAACSFTLSRSSDQIGAPGGRLTVAVSTLTGCAWTATVNANWIAITSAQSGTANATIELAVSANTGPARVTIVNVGGQTCTVSQDAAPAPTPTPSPPPPAPPTSPAPAPAHVSFSGEVTSATGKCPNLTLVVGGRIVITDKTTTFGNISCGDVAKGGEGIKGDGTVISGITVHADTIQKAGG